MDPDPSIQDPDPDPESQGLNLLYMTAESLCWAQKGRKFALSLSARAAPQNVSIYVCTERFIFYRNSVLHLLKHIFHVHLTLVMMGVNIP